MSDDDFFKISDRAKQIIDIVDTIIALPSNPGIDTITKALGISLTLSDSRLLFKEYTATFLPSPLDGIRLRIGTDEENPWYRLMLTVQQMSETDFGLRGLDKYGTPVFDVGHIDFRGHIETYPIYIYKIGNTQISFVFRAKNLEIVIK